MVVEEEVKTTILIVEDEAIVANDTKFMLESLGYIVSDIVVSGQEAFQSLKSTEPNLVLMDIKLKGNMDGVEAAKHIHEHFNVPVIFITAYSDSETLQRAKSSKPFGFLLKLSSGHSTACTI